jgi:YidC/Oxa1 family membrane protein insertase
MQAKMMMAMPLVFGFMLASTPSGLVLYWLTSNVVGIVQQLAMNKYGPAASSKAEKTAKKK